MVNQKITEDSLATNNRRVIYLGPFLDEGIVKERGIPFQNAAGSNRMERISLALKYAGYNPIILSPGISLRASVKGIMFHDSRVRRQHGIPVVFSRALNIVGLNILTSFFFQLLCLQKLLKNGQCEGIIVYNFNISLVLICAYLKYVYRLPIINNIEDVSIPALKDWRSGAEVRPVQQIIFYICMNLVAFMADAMIIPTKRFLDYLPKTLPFIILNGCIEVNEKLFITDRSRNNTQLRVLYAGKIEHEHGIKEFIEALQQLDALPHPPKLCVDFTGAGVMTDWVKQKIGKLQVVKAIFHGFVSTTTYAYLLDRADVCVALQNPKGRYANFKTPSKVYEFLGSGKAVISTNVGDFSDLPKNSIILIDQLDATTIAEKLLWLFVHPSETETLKLMAYRYAKDSFSYSSTSIALKKLLLHTRELKK
jgi:glycosyltransferase involved in cell wall biosynthesis